MRAERTPFVAVREVGRGPALVFAPHPDDEVFGCAGAILRHVAAGDPVTVVVVTDGGAGVPAPERAAYVAARAAESRAAAQVLGYGQPELWGLADGGLSFGEDLVARLLSAIERTGATFVYVPSPAELHPDHAALALSGAEAARRCARDVRLVFYEVSAPGAPNLLLDITDLLEQKRAAMRCFTSQLARQRYDEHVLALNRYRTYTLPAEVAAAEGYRVLAAEEVRGATRATGTCSGWGAPPVDGRRPLVSVVIRTMGRSTLQQAVDSVVSQTWDSLEVVLVDAAGGGAPQVRCDRFEVRPVSLGRPLGRSEAANEGLAAARGRFVMLLDDDDWLYPDHVATLAEALQDERLGRAVYAGVEQIEVSAAGARRCGVFNQPFDPSRLLYENFIPIHAMLFDRDLVAAGCRFDAGLLHYEDWDFWLQLATRTQIRHVDRVSAAYRWPGASGVHGPGAPAAVKAFEAVLSKWQPRWTPDQVAALARRVREREHALGSAWAELAKQQQAASAAEVDAAAARAEVALARQETRAALEALERVSAELAERDRRVAELLASLSWRCTGPLRATLRQLRGW